MYSRSTRRFPFPAWDKHGHASTVKPSRASFSACSRHRRSVWRPWSSETPVSPPRRSFPPLPQTLLISYWYRTSRDGSGLNRVAPDAGVSSRTKRPDSPARNSPSQPGGARQPSCSGSSVWPDGLPLRTTATPRTPPHPSPGAEFPRETAVREGVREHRSTAGFPPGAGRGCVEPDCPACPSRPSDSSSFARSRIEIWTRAPRRTPLPRSSSSAYPRERRKSLAPR